MIKRADLNKAIRMHDELSALETALVHYQAATKLSISSGRCLELQDYPEPSRIGRAFREARAAIITMLEEQIAAARRDLEDLGVRGT